MTSSPSAIPNTGDGDSGRSLGLPQTGSTLDAGDYLTSELLDLT